MVKIEGITAEDASELLPNKEEVWERAKREYGILHKYHEKRRNQKITFDQKRIGIVWIADLHLGDNGVDYERLERETLLIRQTPNMYAMLGGDVANSFILGKMARIRNESNFSIPNEFALFAYWLELIQPALLVVVAGNHDNWFSMLTGIDYFRSVVEKLTPKVLYDQDEVVFTLDVGGWQRIVKARHKWRGNSQYNSTHAIEKAPKFGTLFHIGLGGHIHRGGFARQFEVSDSGEMVEAYALMAGTYKRYDGYARRLGFEQTNDFTAVGLIVDGERHTMTGYTNLEAMANDLTK